jgi:hypothetical protein
MSQHLKEKNPFLDKLLDWYDKSKEADQQEIKKSKEDFINEIRQFKKEQISNTIVEHDKITLWSRIKKTLGIG